MVSPTAGKAGSDYEADRERRASTTTYGDGRPMIQHGLSTSGPSPLTQNLKMTDELTQRCQVGLPLGTK